MTAKPTGTTGTVNAALVRGNIAFLPGEICRALGVGKRTAILTGVSSKSYWHLSRSRATQVGG